MPKVFQLTGAPPTILLGHGARMPHSPTNAGHQQFLLSWLCRLPLKGIYTQKFEGLVAKSSTEHQKFNEKRRFYAFICGLNPLFLPL
jgi:hypothetical protein